MSEIAQSYLAARHYHNAGQFSQAKELYERILAVMPNHADTLHWYGILAAQHNEIDIAIDLVSRSLTVNPNHPDYWSNLGMLYCSRKRFDEASRACQKSIQLNPASPDAHNNLGNAQWGLNKIQEAIDCYQKAIDLRPDFAQAHYNLANGLRTLRQYSSAIDSYCKALELQPIYPEAFCNLGLAYKDQNQPVQAIDAFHKAINLQPSYLEAIINLGSVYAESKQFELAIEQYRKVIQLDPSSSDVCCSLGNLYYHTDQPLLAIEIYQHAIRVKPDNPTAHNDLGNVYKELWMPDEAIACYRQAISLSSERAIFHGNLGSTLKDVALYDESIASIRKALELDPSLVDTHDTLLMTMNYDPRSTSKTILAECKKWDEQHGLPLRSKIKSYPNSLDPDKRLRIGYVSPDFRLHPVGRFLLPIMKHHDKTNVEIYCYSNSDREDEITGQYRDIANHWESVYSLSDDVASEKIRSDQIDILVDLSLHTSGNRLRMFAQKPAPIQFTYAGYPGTTGLSAIDYRFTDSELDPEGSDEHYAEKSIRIPNFWCYDPAIDDDIALELPATRNGYITFGSLHNFCKVNYDVLNLWGKLLRELPNSRLILLAPPDSCRSRVIEQLSQYGVDAGRIEFLNRMPHAEYMRTYHRIDISLDTFPYNGHSTSLDSLWMGVPVVTLVGKTVVGRGGLSQLTSIGQNDLIAYSADEYLEKAKQLSSNLEKLSTLRSSLRDQMRQSALINPAGITTAIEDAYRQKWIEYVRSVQLRPV